MDWGRMARSTGGLRRAPFRWLFPLGVAGLLAAGLVLFGTMSAGAATALNRQTITFGAAPASPRVGHSGTVSATASSLLEVGFSVDATSTGGCSLSNVSYNAASGLTSATVSYTAAGSCKIDANQAGDGTTWAAAPQKQQTLTVALNPQTITFGAAPASPRVGHSGTVSATASSLLEVGFSVDATSTGGCSLSNVSYNAASGLTSATVSYTAAGSCKIDANQAGDGTTWAAAPQKQQTLTVALNPQTITFGAAPASPRVGHSGTVSATASSLLEVGFSVDATSTGGCSLSNVSYNAASGLTSATVSYTAAGSCKIDANQAGDGTTWAAAPQKQQTLTVALNPQTITFGAAPASPRVGHSGTVSATASSLLEVGFSVDATSTGGCSLSNVSYNAASGLTSATVSYTAAGSCKIDANQAGDGTTWAAAPQKQQTLTVALNPQTITFGAAPASPRVGHSGTVSATASSLLEVGFSVDATSTGGCSLSNVSYNAASGLTSATVSYTAAGSCKIDANQAGDGTTWAAAPQKQQTLTVALNPQTITFGAAPASPRVGHSGTVSATASSLLEVGFSVDATSTGGCSLSNVSYNAASGLTSATVSYTAAGSCKIDANQAGDGTTWAAAPQKQQTLTVAASGGGPVPQAITFTSTPPPSPVVGGSYTVTATGGASGNPVTFTIDGSGTPGACSISGAVVSFTGVGTCVIDANRRGTRATRRRPRFSSASIGQGTQAITFTSTPPPSPVVGGSYTVTATGGASGNPVTFTIDGSGTPGACSISGAVVSFTGIGTCVIDANQAGNASYAAAPQVQQSFAIGQGARRLRSPQRPRRARWLAGATP